MAIHSKVERRRLVLEWRASGVSAARFCSERQLPLEPFKAWVRAEVASASQSAGAPVLQLARVAVSEQKALSSVLVVEVGGARIVVERGFDPSLLGSVIAVLRDGGAR
jgi:hypothetical protein